MYLAVCAFMSIYGGDSSLVQTSKAEDIFIEKITFLEHQEHSFTKF